MGSSKSNPHTPTSMLRSPAFAFLALVLAALTLYHDTVFGLVEWWTHHQDPTYQHGLLLAGLGAFLFYRRWAEVKNSIQPRPSFSAAALVLLTSFTWLLASLVHVVIVQELSLLLLLGLLLVSTVGYRSARLLAFPVALLIFAVPSVWEPFRPAIQWLTAHAVTFLVNLTSIPAFLDGSRISVPAGTFEVTPHCSGLANLIVGTLAAALFAHINRLRPGTAIWTLVGAVGVSFLANALRVGAIVVTGQLTGMQHYFVLTDHGALGWGFFGVCIVIFLFIISRVIGPDERAPDTASARATSALVAGKQRAGLGRSALLSLGALAFGPALVYAYQPDRSGIVEHALNLPAEIGNWRATPAPRGGYRPVVATPDLEHERLYRDAQGHLVYLYVAEYAYQQQGREAVSNANRVYDGRTWQPVLTRTRHLGDGNTVQETRLQSRAEAQKIVWHWYYVHGFAVSNRYMAKLLNAWSTLNSDAAAAVVVVATDYDGSDESTEALGRFVADAKQTVERAIDRARQR